MHRRVNLTSRIPAVLRNRFIACRICELDLHISEEKAMRNFLRDGRNAEIDFLMVAALIAVCWGIFGEPVLCAASILMWGTGDAAAALVGIPFGKHKIKTRWTDGKKSREGTAAMFAVSFVSGLLMLLLAHEAGLPYALLSAAVGALFGALTELFSPSEYDTVTVPSVIAAVLLLINAAVR